MGCDDGACSALVCAVDTFCCGVSWDATCVERALELCPGCPDGAPPVNDDCSDAVLVEDGVIAYTTDHASTDGPTHDACQSVDCHGDIQVYRDVWFRFFATSGGMLDVTTCGDGDFDSRVAVYAGCGCPGSGSLLVGCVEGDAECDDDGATVTFLASAGACYLVRIGSRDGRTGSGTLQLGGAGLECGDGPCDRPNGTPGCDWIDCCVAVCEIDPFCCQTGWDAVCVDTAQHECFVGIDCICPFLGDGPCCRPNPTPSCNVPECCYLVCSYEAFCCDVAWDETCAALAGHFCVDVCRPVPCPLDFVPNGVIDVGELAAVILGWGEPGPADVSGDGTVDVVDLGIVILNWGTCW